MSRRCDYYILCDAQIQESLSEGERGEARLPKNNRNNIIFNFQPSTDFTVLQGEGSSIFQGGPTFSRGGGPDAYFHKNAYNL